MKQFSGRLRRVVRLDSILVMLFCLHVASGTLSAASRQVSAGSFNLDLETELSIGVSALAVAGGAWLLADDADADLVGTLDLDDVNWFDRQFMVPYDQTLDTVSDVTCSLSLVSPALLLLLPDSDWKTIGVMYAQTLALSYGLRQLGKNLFDRARPYMYFDDAPSEDDWDQSFPSGHTTVAFASASFASYVFGTLYPDSRWKVPVAVGSYALAGVTAALRVCSGSHFVSDVVAGAILGTVSGILVPRLHLDRQDDGTVRTTVAVVPSGVVFTVSV
jgi:undecaprenyl-diphosphatase